MTRTKMIVDGRMMFQPQCYGIARVTVEMVKRFPRAADTDVVLLVPGHRNSDHFATRELADVAEIVTCSDPVTSPHRFQDLRRVTGRSDRQVYFAPYHAVLPLSVPGPVVAMVHDCILEADLRLVGGRIKRAAYMANTARVLRRSAALVVPSEATAAVLPAFYGRVPPVSVCRNGVAERSDRLGPDAVAAVRQQLDLPARFVLHVGARRPHKNQAVLLRALTHLPPEIGLVLVGKLDPRTPDELPALAADLDLTSRVRFLDSLADEHLAAVYQAADVFAFPSVAEGFGLPPLEAMAAGVPVVASAIPVLAEVGKDAALYVSPFDPAGWAAALNRVIADPQVRERMICRGLEVAADAGWNAGAQNLYQVLTEVAGSH